MYIYFCFIFDNNKNISFKNSKCISNNTNILRIILNKQSTLKYGDELKINIKPIIPKNANSSKMLSAGLWNASNSSANSSISLASSI